MDAIKLKEEGNKYFREKQYDKAINFYTMAIEKDATDPTFFSNRAQCHLKLENFGSALQDSNSAIKLDPNFTKAYYR